MRRKLQALFLALATAAILAVVLFHAPRGKVTILMYHHLVEEDGETNSLTITADKFRRDMQYLKDNDFTTLLPEELVPILRGKRPCPERAVVVSFDDGYRSNYTLAYPILREYGCKAVISLITANIREAREEDAFMLSWPEVEEMAAGGLVAFGSHTDNLHNAELGGALRKGPGAYNGVQRRPGEPRGRYNARVGADLRRSFSLLEAHTGSPALWFAYPYGAGDRWCEGLLKELGVPVSVSTEPGKARVGWGTRDLPRCAVRQETELSELLPLPENGS